MPTVLITGANGLLATHVIMELLAQGYQVKGLLRDNQRFQLGEHPHLVLIQGDFTHPPTIREAVRNCDFVIHAAALTNQNLIDYAPYQRVNVEAVKEIMKASIKEGVKKVVHVSSANAFGFGTKEHPGDETRLIRKPFSESLYANSKLEGQQLALSFKDQIEVTVVNPTFMLGAYDAKPGSGRILLMGFPRKILFYPPGGKNFVDVGDVATGVLKALKQGNNGEAYLLGGENLSYLEFFKKLSHITHQRPLYIRIPKGILLLVGLIGSILRTLGIATQLSLNNMKILCINNFYSNHKASGELGLEFKPIDNGIEEGIAWFIKEGRIKKGEKGEKSEKAEN
jgi:nucleoside-diphosphate-sugar epimerase